MRNLSSSAKKALAIVLTLGMIISLFSCMSGISAFAVDNTPSGKAAVTPVVQEEVKETNAVTADPVNGGAHVHCVCGGTYSASWIHGSSATNPHPNSTFNPASSRDDLKNGYGLYYLTQDVEIATTITVTGTFHICLNGYKLILKATALFRLKNNLTTADGKDRDFTICDCKRSEGTGGIYQDPNSEQNASGTVVQTSKRDNTTDYHKFRVYFYQVNIDLTASTGWSGLAFGAATGSDWGDTEIYLVGSKIDGSPTVCRAGNGGIANINANGILYVLQTDITGSKVTGNAGVVNLAGNATLKFYSGSMSTAGTVGGSGGLIFGADGTTIDIQGGTLTGTTAKNGGAIYTEGKLKISGGTIQNGIATGTYGGNVYTASTPATNNFEMTGGTIKGGKVTTTTVANGGGNLYVNTVTASITGGTITGGTHTNMYNTGGNIYVGSRCTLTLSGTTKVTGGIAGYGGNIALMAGTATEHAKVIVDGAEISGGQSFQTRPSMNYGGNFHVDKYGEVEIKSGTVADGKVWAGVGANICLRDTGAKLTVSGGTISGGVANGSRAAVSGKSPALSGRGGAVYMAPGTSFVMTDGLITGSTANGEDGGSVFIDGASFEMTGGKIEKGSTFIYGNGGNIYAQNATKFDIGGEAVIDDGLAGNGGNIYLKDTADAVTNTVLNISGNAVISNGHNGHPDTGLAQRGSTCYGGNVYSLANTTVNISGGSIVDGKVDLALNAGADGKDIGCMGGNLYVGGHFTMTDGVISGGYAKYYGGNIYFSSVAVDAEISGGSIKDGNVMSGYVGGNIFLDGSSEVVVGGTAEISGGKAAKGGNIYMSSKSTLYVTENAVVKDGADQDGRNAEAMGGNIHVGGTFYMTGGTVKDGTVKGRGGNIYVTAAGTVHHSAGTVEGGKALDYNKNETDAGNAFGGGNVYSDGTYNLSDDGVVQDGQALGKLAATKGGGGNFSLGGLKSKLVMSGGLIQNGVATIQYAGNIYIWYQAPTDVMTMTGGTIIAGDAEVEGAYTGGIEVYFSNGNAAKALAVSGESYIDDVVTVFNGSSLNVNELDQAVGGIKSVRFVVSGGGRGSGVIGTWDSLYEGVVNSELDADENPYYQFKALSDNQVAAILSKEAELVEKANSFDDDYDYVNVDNKDILIDASELSDFVKETLELSISEPELDEAKLYDDMMAVRYEVFDNGDNYIVAFYAGVDAESAALYDVVTVSVKMNGKTKTKNITGAYEGLAYGGETFVEASSIDNEKVDYLYCATLSLPKTYFDDQSGDYHGTAKFEAYVTITMNGKSVVGPKTTGVLNDFVEE